MKIYFVKHRESENLKEGSSRGWKMQTWNDTTHL